MQRGKDGLIGQKDMKEFMVILEHKGKDVAGAVWGRESSRTT